MQNCRVWLSMSGHALCGRYLQRAKYRSYVHSDSETLRPPIPQESRCDGGRSREVWRQWTVAVERGVESLEGRLWLHVCDARVQQRSSQVCATSTLTLTETNLGFFKPKRLILWQIENVPFHNLIGSIPLKCGAHKLPVFQWFYDGIMIKALIFLPISTLEFYGDENETFGTKCAADKWHFFKWWRIPTFLQTWWTLWLRLRSIRRSVSDSVFHSLVVSLVMSRLHYGNATCWASLVPAPSTSVGAQRRRQTDTPIYSVRAHHTDAARPSLVAVSWTHRLQARLPMPAWSGATVPFRPHPARCWF